MPYSIGMTADDIAAEAGAPDLSTVTAVARAAGRAPSLHNSQPWRLFFDGTRLHLSGDPERLLPMADPSGRQRVISCGALLHHLEVAFEVRGWHADVDRLPDPDQPDLLATVGFQPVLAPGERVVALAGAIGARRSFRPPMAAPPGWERALPELTEAAAGNGIAVDELPEPASDRLAAASGQAEALRRFDQPYQSELRWWTGNFDLPEGIPPTALTPAGQAERVPVRRDFPTPPGPARPAGAEVDRARLIALSSTGDSPEQWLRTGEALSAVLLAATAAGFGTCPLTHITELPAARRILAGLLPDGRAPQVVVRIGAAPPPEPTPPTPRRTVTDYLETR